MPHSVRYIVVREPDGFVSLIIGPIRYPLSSQGWNRRGSHIQAMREKNRWDIAYHRNEGKTVTIERSYPHNRNRQTVRVGQIELESEA